MKIYLDETDAPNPADREAARQIIEAILEHDVFTKGSFVLEGYSAARRIAHALTMARRDERRRGFDIPYWIRKHQARAGRFGRDGQISGCVAALSRDDSRWPPAAKVSAGHP